MLDQLRDGDTVVVWKLDRLSRSLKDMLHIMERIAKPAQASAPSLHHRSDRRRAPRRAGLASSFEQNRAVTPNRDGRGPVLADPDPPWHRLEFQPLGASALVLECYGLEERPSLPVRIKPRRA
jgi:hypothetical protein